MHRIGWGCTGGRGCSSKLGLLHMPSADLNVLDVTQTLTLAGTPSSEECQLDECLSCECCQRAALGLPSSCRNVGSFKTVRRRLLGEASGKGRGSGSGCRSLKVLDIGADMLTNTIVGVPDDYGYSIIYHQYPLLIIAIIKASALEVFCLSSGKPALLSVNSCGACDTPLEVTF